MNEETSVQHRMNLAEEITFHMIGRALFEVGQPSEDLMRWVNRVADRFGYQDWEHWNREALKY